MRGFGPNLHALGGQIRVDDSVDGLGSQSSRAMYLELWEVWAVAIYQQAAFEDDEFTGFPQLRVRVLHEFSRALLASVQAESFMRAGIYGIGDA